MSASKGNRGKRVICLWVCLCVCVCVCFVLSLDDSTIRPEITKE